MDFDLLQWIISEGTGALACAGVIWVLVRQGKTRDELTARMDAHEKDCSDYRRTEAARGARIEEHVKAIDKRLEEGNRRFDRIEDK